MQHPVGDDLYLVVTPVWHYLAPLVDRLGRHVQASGERLYVAEVLDHILRFHGHKLKHT